jgi:hypothetical protein
VDLSEQDKAETHDVECMLQDGSARKQLQEGVAFQDDKGHGEGGQVGRQKSRVGMCNQPARRQIPAEHKRDQRHNMRRIGQKEP